MILPVLSVVLFASQVLKALTACTNLQFSNDGGTTCLSCDSKASGGIENCYSCIYNTDKKTTSCTQCKSSFFLKSNTCFACNDPVEGYPSCKECLYIPTTKQFICSMCIDSLTQINQSCLPCFDTILVTSCQYCAIVIQDKMAYGLTCAICKDGFFSYQNACAPCNTAIIGIPNCNKCSYSSANPQVVCSSCSDGYYLIKDKQVCSPCSSSCKTCLVPEEKNDAGAVVKGNCNTCLLGKYLDPQDSTCKSCTPLCQICTSPGLCSSCFNSSHFIEKPDTGACVEVCGGSKLKGSLTDYTTQVCTTYPLPKIGAGYQEILVADQRTIDLKNICSPGSSDDATKKLEKVGAIVIISKGGGSYNTIDIKSTRDYMFASLKNANPLFNDSILARQDYLLVEPEKIYLSIMGTEAGDGNYAKLNIFRGLSTLQYTCFNKFNMVSEMRTISVIGNSTLNKIVSYNVIMERSLTDIELNNLTCMLSVVVFDKNFLFYRYFLNQKYLFCNQSLGTRLLQVTPKPLETYFSIYPNQADDSITDAAITRFKDVSTVISAFANNSNITIYIPPKLTQYDSNVASFLPNVSAYQNKSNASSIIVSVSAQSQTILYWASSLSPKTDYSIRGIDTDIFERGAIFIGMNETVNITLTKNITKGKTLYFSYIGSDIVKPDRKNKVGSLLVEAKINLFSPLIKTGLLFLIFCLTVL